MQVGSAVLIVIFRIFVFKIEDYKSFWNLADCGEEFPLLAEKFEILTIFTNFQDVFLFFSISVGAEAWSPRISTCRYAWFSDYIINNFHSIILIDNLTEFIVFKQKFFGDARVCLWYQSPSCASMPSEFWHPPKKLAFAKA